MGGDQKPINTGRMAGMYAIYTIKYEYRYTFYHYNPSDLQKSSV